jgi:hypothetical protein
MNYVVGNANIFLTVVFRVVTPCSLICVDDRFGVFAATIFWDEFSAAITPPAFLNDEGNLLSR